MALPLVASRGERKGNLLMQRFVERLRAWSAASGCGESAPSCAAVPLTLGRYGERRGFTVGGALLLRLSLRELEAQKEQQGGGAHGSGGRAEVVVGRRPHAQRASA